MDECAECKKIREKYLAKVGLKDPLFEKLLTNLLNEDLFLDLRSNRKVCINEGDGILFCEAHAREILEEATGELHILGKTEQYLIGVDIPKSFLDTFIISFNRKFSCERKELRKAKINEHEHKKDCNPHVLISVNTENKDELYYFLKKFSIKYKLKFSDVYNEDDDD